MKTKKTSTIDIEKEIIEKELIANELDENFDWDWIFDREWLRTKK